MTPRVSVVIAHFNRSSLLRKAIDSVVRGLEGGTEVVVVDDGSSDDEWIEIQRYCSQTVQVIQREGGAKGPSRCRNIGVRASRGEYVIFLDSDDIMAPWCVEQRLRLTADSPGRDFWVFPVLLFTEKPGDSDVLWNRMDDGRDHATRFAAADAPWHTSSPLWRKSALERIGGFNEAMLYGDDSELHVRALVSGLTYGTYAEALPDVFIRRSDAPRITNSLSCDLVESRRVRLSEGEKFLREQGEGPALWKLWEAQYFVESEFLLFNFDGARAAIEKVLGDWERAFAPSGALRRSVRAYFAIGLATRHRAYLLLRVARRAAMLILPAAFFPSGGDVAPPTAPASTMKGVQKLMGNG